MQWGLNWKTGLVVAGGAVATYLLYRYASDRGMLPNRPGGSLPASAPTTGVRVSSGNDAATPTRTTSSTPTRTTATRSTTTTSSRSAPTPAGSDLICGFLGCYTPAELQNDPAAQADYQAAYGSNK